MATANPADRNNVRATITGEERKGDLKLDNWLEQRARTCPERVALICEGEQISFAELEEEAQHAARRLVAHGVRRGTTAAVTMGGGRRQIVAHPRPDEDRGRAAPAQPQALDGGA